VPALSLAVGLRASVVSCLQIRAVRPVLVQVPLDAVDPSRQSLLYTQGDQAAVSPIYDYDFSILYGAAAQSSWREILWYASSSVCNILSIAFRVTAWPSMLLYQPWCWESAASLIAALFSLQVGRAARAGDRLPRSADAGRAAGGARRRGDGPPCSLLPLPAIFLLLQVSK
jgi:hypothetical protein